MLQEKVVCTNDWTIWFGCGLSGRYVLCRGAEHFFYGQSILYLSGPERLTRVGPFSARQSQSPAVCADEKSTGPSE